MLSASVGLCLSRYDGSPFAPGKSPNTASKPLFSRTMRNTCSMILDGPSVFVSGTGKSCTPAGHETVGTPGCVAGENAVATVSSPAVRSLALGAGTCWMPPRMRWSMSLLPMVK